MSTFPFHVAGGAFAAQPPAAPDFAQLLRQAPPADEATPAVHGSRRRKLWEISHKFHCPLTGICFEVEQLRALMAKVMQFPRETTDFVLHTTAVGGCETRTALAELLHRTLEKRYALTIRCFAAAKDAAGLRALWREATRTGTEIPGALWASWTHPACDTLLGQEIYGDIHMIQHQVGTGTRADLAALQALKAENLQLRRQLDEARREIESQRQQKLRETRALARQLAELRADLAGKEAWGASLSSRYDTLSQSLPDLRDRQSLARRAGDAEARASALTARAAELETDNERLRELARQAEATIAQLLAPGELAADAPAADDHPEALAGKCILCVGGRSGAVDAYRQIVEQRGGRFLHHDGGLEESLHRIDAALSAADLVVCQTGCISHNAYWRVKEQCKRSGKPCVFLKGAGVSSFGRVVGIACASGEAAG